MNVHEIVHAVWGVAMLVGVWWGVLQRRRLSSLFAPMRAARPKAALGFDVKRGVEVKTHAEEGDDDG